MNILRFARPQVLFAPDGVGGGGGTPAPSTGGGGTPAPSSTPSSSPSGGSAGSASSSSPSGASPSPAPTPSSTPSAAPATAPGTSTPPAAPSPGPPEGVFDFDSAFSDDGADDDTLTPPQPPQEPQATPPQSPQEPQPPAPAAGTPQAEPPAQTAPGQQEPTPLPTPAEPQAIAEAMMQNRDAVLEHLAQNEFKLTPEDIEALETDAPAHIPKLLANLYLKSQVNMLQQVSKIIPAMMQKMQRVSEANTKNEGKFYSRWPDLKPDLHGAIVRRNAALYRQINPQASLDQMIEDLGPIVMVAAKVQPGASAAPNGNGGVIPPAPGARMVAPPSPFRPAGSGPSSAPPQPGGDNNPWSGLAGTFQDEDE